MGQLMMMRTVSPIDVPDLPSGYALRAYRDGDWKGWTEACADGLGTGAWTEQDFEQKMLGMEGLNPEGIFLLVDDTGRIAGTATGWVKPEYGYLHMVGIRPESRGRGLARALNARAVAYLVERGCSRIRLDTDDFRIPAIKSYLALGFLPVLYEADMRERWLQIMRTIGVSQVDAYDGVDGPVVRLHV